MMPTVKKKRKSVIINEEEQVINPEDIDPSVGKFRNLIQSTIVIPNKVCFYPTQIINLN
jgi:nuclear inhibitor of protein phosphatase 1